MDKNLERKLAALIDAEDAGLSNFDSSMGFDNDMAHSYTGRGQMKPQGQTTFDFKIVHDGAGGAGTVDIELFKALFNTGTYAGETLTFASGGNTVTITGLTASFKALQERAKSQPFRINFARIRPLGEAQLANNITFDTQSVFGGSKQNSISPSTYVDPNQYQTLNVDVPLNFVVGDSTGLNWTINDSETIIVTLFIDLVYDVNKAMTGVSPVRNVTRPALAPASAARLSLNS